MIRSALTKTTFSVIGLRCIPLLALALSGCTAETLPTETRPPNIVLITLDTTRADHLGVYGYPRGTSPALDDFARDAVVYDHAWATAPWTLPSHASLLTGKYPTSHGAHYVREGGEANLSRVLTSVPKNNFRANRLPESHRTLAEILRDRGYATGAFSAGHWLAKEFGVLQGYDDWDTHVQRLEGKSAEELNRSAFRWIRNVPADQPLHLLINYFDPHDPYTPNETDRLPIETLETDVGLDPKIRRDLDAYDAEIHYMDRHLSFLFDTLREENRFDHAMIIVVADHGEFFGEHGLVNHGPWLNEELLRIPMIVRYPGERGGGRRDSTPVSLVDALPMIAQEVGFELPPGVEGKWPQSAGIVLAESRTSPFHLRKLGKEVDRDLRAVIDWPWKLIAGTKGSRNLFRLDHDPKELKPIQDPDRMATLEDRLASAVRAFDPPRQGTTPENVPNETEDNLRALGYIE